MRKDELNSFFDDVGESVDSFINQIKQDKQRKRDAAAEKSYRLETNRVRGLPTDFGEINKDTKEAIGKKRFSPERMDYWKGFQSKRENEEKAQKLEKEAALDEKKAGEFEKGIDFIGPQKKEDNSYNRLAPYLELSEARNSAQTKMKEAKKAREEANKAENIMKSKASSEHEYRSLHDKAKEEIDPNNRLYQNLMGMKNPRYDEFIRDFDEKTNPIRGSGGGGGASLYNAAMSALKNIADAKYEILANRKDPELAQEAYDNYTRFINIYNNIAKDNMTPLPSDVFLKMNDQQADSMLQQLFDTIRAKTGK